MLIFMAIRVKNISFIIATSLYELKQYQEAKANF